MSARTGRRISRRAFFRLGAVAALGAFASGGVVAWLTRNYSLSILAERIREEIDGYRYGHLPFGEAIRRHFHYLEIEPEAIATFAREFEAAYGRPTWHTNLKDVYLRFLMSTDFFQNGADESRTLRFATFYSPARNPCYNPLARLF